MIKYHESFWGISYKVDAIFCIALFFIALRSVNAEIALSFFLLSFVSFYIPDFNIFILIPILIYCLVSIAIKPSLYLIVCAFFTLVTLLDWHVFRFEEPYMWPLFFGLLWLAYALYITIVSQGFYVYKISVLLSTVVIISIPFFEFFNMSSALHLFKLYFYQVWYSVLALQVVSLLKKW